jgi:hypothetical protein
MATIQTEYKSISETGQGWFYVGKLVGMAFLVTLGVAGLKFGAEHLLTPRNAGLGGLLSQNRSDLLLIGSSHTRQSYDMRVLEKASGVTNSYLCAYSGMNLDNIALILDYLAQHPERLPRNIIVEAYSSRLARSPDVQDPRLYFDAPPPLKSAIVSSYLSTRHSPTALLDIFDLGVNRGNDQILFYPIYSWAERSASYKGGRTDIVNQGVSAEEFKTFQADTGSADPDPAQLAAYHHIVRLAHQYHIGLILIESPMPQPVSHNPRIQHLKSVFRALVAADHYLYIDGDLGFPIENPAMFSDDNHLSTEGRILFTTRIGEALKTVPGLQCPYNCPPL